MPAAPERKQVLQEQEKLPVPVIREVPEVLLRVRQGIPVTGVILHMEAVPLEKGEQQKDAEIETTTL